MKPSFWRTASPRARRLEPGELTVGLLRACALRMRAMRSPIGSFTTMSLPSPARLHQAGDQPPAAQFAQRDAGEPELAVIAARPAGDIAAVANARGRGIARHLRKLERGGEALLHRLRPVTRDRLQPRAPAADDLGHLSPPVVLFDRTLLRHSPLLGFR